MKKEYAEKKHEHSTVNSLLMIALVFGIIGYGFALYSGFQINGLQEEIDSMPHYECRNETNYSEKDSCFDDCFKLANWNFSGICNPNIIGDCETTRIKGLRADQDFELCVRADNCLGKKPQVKEVCEIVPKTEGERK